MLLQDDFYFEWTKEYEALVKYVQRQLLDDDAYEAEELCADIHGECEFSFSLDHIFRPVKTAGIEFEKSETSAGSDAACYGSFQ
ncbi:hypothetical protein GCM10009001_29040 [Virgibacillus siamensis]|uniref:Uncharacterized protein n=1 Tax=Virgibacillus siamensis TaxID=480071 RepID=A0ABP3RLD0_9BACI